MKIPHKNRNEIGKIYKRQHAHRQECVFSAEVFKLKQRGYYEGTGNLNKS